jgi:hypothetical protein
MCLAGQFLTFDRIGLCIARLPLLTSKTSVNAGAILIVTPTEPIILIGMVPKVVRLSLSKPSALQIIRDVAEKDTARVIYTHHALKRMRERKITTLQVLKCLRKGQIVEGPALGIKGNWECKLSWQHAGDVINVVVAIDQDQNTGEKVLIVTVYG